MTVCVAVKFIEPDECVQINGLTIECKKQGVLDIQGVNRKNGEMQHVEITHEAYYDSRLDEIKFIDLKNVLEVL